MKRKNKLFWVLLISLILVLISIITLNYNSINLIIQNDVQVYGYPAIFIFSMLSNSFDQPIGPDSIALFGFLFGLEFFLLFFIIVAGVWTMGLVNYSIGRKFFSKRIDKINYSVISLVILIFLSILIIYFSGILGFFVFLTATCIGITCQLFAIKRSILMSSLIFPTIFLYLPF